MQLYQAHRSEHDPLDKAGLLDRYFDPTLLKLYQKDKREAKGEVGRLDGDPLYNAQDVDIKHFFVSEAEMTGGPSRTGIEARVTVNFKNLDKPTRVLYILSRTANGWKISDIRYDDGSSLKKIWKSSPGGRIQLFRTLDERGYECTATAPRFSPVVYAFLEQCHSPRAGRGSDDLEGFIR
jgi:hypothetical protein